MTLQFQSDEFGVKSGFKIGIEYVVIGNLFIFVASAHDLFPNYCQSKLLIHNTLLNLSDDSCPRENFLCANENCLDASYLCNGKNDCGDNSDEGTICSGNNE